MVPIEALKLVNFRNYAEKAFQFGGEDVVFRGPNGAGKTNLLEAICFLSVLRSFRTVSGREMVRIGERFFELCCILNRSGFREELRVVQRANGEREIFIDGRKLRRSSDFIQEFRAVVFVPEDRNIPAGSSSFRRRFFDMLIATQEREYLKALSSYNRALMQRNRALKSSAGEKIAAAFEPELAACAPQIAARRRIYASLVEKEVDRLLGEETGSEFSIRYKSDYSENPEEYLAQLRKNREKERIRACTCIGPQLDEFEFLLDGRPLRSYGSTGQIRIIALLLKLAEFNLFRRTGSRLVVLTDDVTGELDERNRTLFLKTIKSADQRFFTFTEMPSFLKEVQQIEIDGELTEN